MRIATRLTASPVELSAATMAACEADGSISTPNSKLFKQ